jgi:hypothetical protein
MNASKEISTVNKKSATKAKALRATDRWACQARGKGGKKAKRTSSPIGVTAEERWRMIAVAAYHKAEQRGFAPDGSMDDGLEAEKEIDVLLGVAQT